jgi:soluble calcium-activated nucleotidase 1
MAITQFAVGFSLAGAVVGFLWAYFTSRVPGIIPAGEFQHLVPGGRLDPRLSDRVNFALVSDNDIYTRDPESFTWVSYLRNGWLMRQGDLDSNYTVEWNTTLRMESHMARLNRSMELSEFIWWNGKFLACCDYTGIIYKVRPHTGEVFPRFVLADGGGKTTKTFKAEWMSHYGDKLLIGSHGKAWVDKGVVKSYGNEWVKEIHPSGKIVSVNWGPRYRRMRELTGTNAPGYMSHEAVLWLPLLQRWIFLPRKVSMNDSAMYNTEDDFRKSSNWLIWADENFENITHATLGPLEPEWGFVSVRQVPGTLDVMVVKVRETDTEMKSKVGVFDLLTGESKLAGGWAEVDDGWKYEGLAFLGKMVENW